jgi:hypothetical protein
MALNSVYRKYFQKSKVFIYPLLGIKRGTSVVPTETYVSWEDHYAPEDMKLVCVYNVRKDNEYLYFEKNTLLRHTRLTEYIKINSETSVFIFDFSDMGADWYNFLEGKYSKIDMNLKQKILNFFDKYSGNYAYMSTYLFPEKHFGEYAELLQVNVEILKSVGELCSKPDIESENFTMAVADFENIEKSKLNL